jgi:hypothetical protein
VNVDKEKLVKGAQFNNYEKSMPLEDEKLEIDEEQDK